VIWEFVEVFGLEVLSEIWEFFFLGLDENCGLDYEGEFFGESEVVK